MTSEELERVEVLDRDDPDSGQALDERLYVVLQVDALQAPRDQLGVAAVAELRETDDADPPPPVQELGHAVDEVPVVADQQDVVLAVGKRGEGALDRDVDD